MDKNQEINSAQGVDEKGSEIKEEAKQTNRVFTQSELDSYIASEKKKIEGKYGDYNEVKSKLESLEKLQKEREEAELSESEKLKKQLEEKESLLNQLAQETKSLKIANLKNEVLTSKEEFRILPKAYRKMVKGEDLESIQLSANEVLAEFQNDAKELVKGNVKNFLPLGGEKTTPDLSKGNSIKDVFAKAGERFNFKREQ